MHVDRLTGSDAVAELAGEWLALHRDTASATPYNHPGWALSWWRRRTGEGLRWRCFVARDGAHRLAGVLPLVRYPDGVIRYAGHDLYDVAGALSTGPALPALWGGALESLRRADGGSTLELPTLAAEDEATLRGQLPPGAVQVTGVDPGARLDLSTGWDALLATTSPRRRKRMRADRRALERDHGPVRLDITGPDRSLAQADKLPLAQPAGKLSLAQAADELWTLRERSWRLRGRYQLLAPQVRGEAFRAFLRELAGETGAGGLVSVARLRVGARLGAAALCLRAGRRLWYAFCAFSPDLARYGPGRVLLAECARNAAAAGISSLELGRGVEPYKFTIGATRYELPDVTVRMAPR